MGWGYDSSYLSKEALYEEVENVLRRHPTLKIIFPHFYFLSADLDLARRWLRKYPYIHFDLAPGIELYYNLSQNFAQARDFFIEFSGRIIYGTDILGSHSVAEVKARAGIIFRFLSTVDEFRIPPEADFLLGKPEDGNIQGLGLPEDVLRSITQDNFRKIFGNHPREIKKEAARAECLRLAEIESEVNGTRIRETDAFRAARELEKNQ
jgi:predicted TIM-barrel fold metal-dependent hydrolase